MVGVTSNPVASIVILITYIIREIKDILPTEEILSLETKPLPKSKKSLETLIKEKQKEMKDAAQALDFELAAILRDEVIELNKKIKAK